MSAGEAAALVSKGELRRRATSFAKRFADATSEKSESQTFWNEFFAVFGIERAQVAAFEQLAKRSSTGNHGWIDLLFPSQMGVEQKSRGEDLDAAMVQILDYLPSLTPAEHPWLLVACDFERFRWRNLNDGTSGAFLLEELADNLDLFWWIARYPTPDQRFENVEDANLAASDLMATVHDRMADLGYGGHPLREWLTRLLFCMFADDTGVWSPAALQAYVAAHTAPDGSDLGPRLAYLFQVLNTPHEKRSSALDEELDQFTYINGDLFEETLPIPACDAQVRDAILLACRFDWTAISPAVFGAMFQNVMEPPERRQLGAHYTTEENILRTIRPLFLDDLEAELGRARTKPALERFLAKLASLTFFDPACGCGNFLVVTYRELRRIETEALRKLAPKQGRAGQLTVDVTLQCKVRVDQFYGIEIEEFPAKIARTAMYLVDHLANRDVSREFGEHYVRFPIPAAPNIVHANALRMDWEDVLPVADADYVFGNPPFIGHALTTDEQQDDKQHAFETAQVAGVRAGRLDYVACWYALALKYGKNQPIRFAFVSTNSITQGEQAQTLGPLLRSRGYEIDFGHRTFAWTSEAKGKAHVHVVIIGFSHGGIATSKKLFDYPDINDEPIAKDVSQLNFYLVDGPNLYPDKRRSPLIQSLPRALKGSQPTDGGHLIVDGDEYDQVAADPIAAKYLRRLIGARDMLRDEQRWCLWLVDASPAELRQSPVLRDRLTRTRDARLQSKTASVQEAAATPALFTQRRQPRERYTCIPRHSSERRPIVPMAMYEAEHIAHDSVVTIDGLPLWAFGILQSAMFSAWVRSVCGRLKSDIRIAPDLAYHAFPFIPLTAAQRTRIETATNAVLDARAAHPESTLADLYDPISMPSDLVAAHQGLDKATDSAFAPRRKFASDADRLAVLFERYAELTGELAV